MKDKIIKASISYRSDEYYDENPAYVMITLNKEMLEAIKTARKVLKENKTFNSIKIDACADLFDEDGKESKFSPSAEALIVYGKSGLFYYTQCKYDSATYIESEDLKI
jgi:hypothetical protein